MQSFSFFGQRMGFAQLVGMGVHVGHSLENSSVFSSWMVYGYRAGVCLIDLFKFVTMLRFGLSIINLLVALGRPLWFVNKDKSFARYVRYYALKCGEFSSTLLWIRGLLSNFRVVGRLAKKHFLLSDLARGRRLLLLDTTLGHWFLTRYTWPGLIFVSSILLNYFVVQETFSSEVPCLGIADSDALVQGCSIAVPGNDDSLDSVVFYHDLLAEYILYRKFTQVYLWFLNVRRSKRLMGFYDWLCLQRKSLVALNLGFFFSSQLRQKYPLGKVILGFFFGKGGWSQALAEQIKVYRDQGFFSVCASLDEHELVLGRYFYLFSFIFFSRLWDRKGNYLLSKRSRKYWRVRYRNSTFMFLRKNMQWRTFRFRRAFKYISSLYSFRRGALAYRGLLLRFVHYYFFFYYLYFHTVRFHRALFKRSRRVALRKRGRFFLRKEYRRYWRYFKSIFKNHWNYESTIRLASARLRAPFLRRRFAIFLLLFKLYHEPTLRRTIKHRLDVADKRRRSQNNNDKTRPFKVSRYVRISYYRWLLWYKKASRKFFSRRHLRRRLFFYLVIPRLAPRLPGPVFGKARELQKLKEARVDPALRQWRARLLANLHGVVEVGARRLQRRLGRSFRFTPFFRTLKGAILRFMIFGFFRPAPLPDSLFVSAGSFARDPWSAGSFGFRRKLGRRSKRRLKRFYSSGSCSLLFRGRKRKFFLGYIPFGIGSKPFQQAKTVFDFSLSHLKRSFFFRPWRRAQFFLARGSYKAKFLSRVPRARRRLAVPRRRPRLSPRQRLRRRLAKLRRRPWLRPRRRLVVPRRRRWWRRRRRLVAPQLRPRFRRWDLTKRFI